MQLVTLQSVKLWESKFSDLIRPNLACLERNGKDHQLDINFPTVKYGSGSIRQRQHQIDRKTAATKYEDSRKPE